MYHVNMESTQINTNLWPEDFTQRTCSRIVDRKKKSASYLHGLRTSLKDVFSNYKQHSSLFAKRTRARLDGSLLRSYLLGGEAI